MGFIISSFKHNTKSPKLNCLSKKENKKNNKQTKCLLYTVCVFFSPKNKCKTNLHNPKKYQLDVEENRQ